MHSGLEQVQETVVECALVLGQIPDSFQSGILRGEAGAEAGT